MTFRLRFLAVCTVAALCSWASPSGAAPVTWRLSGFIDAVYVGGAPSTSLGPNIGDPWSAAITFDPDAPPGDGNPGFQNFPDAVLHVELVSGSFSLASDPTLPLGHGLVVARSGVKNLLALISNTYTSVSPYIALANFGFGVNSTTDYFSFDHLPSSPPDLALGGSSVQIEGSVDDIYGPLFFSIHGTTTILVPEPPAGGFLVLSIALFAALLRCPRADLPRA